MNTSAIKVSLAPIRDRFLRMLDQTQINIQQELELALEEPKGARAAFCSIEARLHKIAGSAGTLGFTELGERARETENYLMSVLKKDGDPPQEAYLRVIGFLEACLDVDSEAA